jgi:hypothetical protein
MDCCMRRVGGASSGCNRGIRHDLGVVIERERAVCLLR